MNQRTNEQKHAFATVFVLSLLLSIAAYAGDDQYRGKAFDGVGKPVEMPPGWTEQAIKYAMGTGDADIVVDLNQQLEATLEPIIREYAEKHNLKAGFTKGTCGKSGAKLDRKEVDIAGFCCPPGEKDYLPGLRFHTLGISPLAIIVHPSNPVNGITLKQTREIFMGEINNWSEVGGPDIPIKRIATPHCKQKPGHWKLLLGNNDLFSPDILETGEMEAMIAFVATNPEAIGFETLLVADRFKDRGPVKALLIDGADPKDPGSLIALDYSIYRTFNITSWEGENIENPHAHKLVNYLLKEVDNFGPGAGILPSSKLRNAGWKFKGDELIGEPE